MYPASYIPQVKGELLGKRVTAVAAGREHSLAVTSEGRVYGWGGRSDVTGRKGSKDNDLR